MPVKTSDETDGCVRLVISWHLSGNIRVCLSVISEGFLTHACLVTEVSTGLVTGMPIQ